MTTTTTPTRDHQPALGNTAGREADKPSPPPVANVWLSVALEMATARPETQKGGTK